MLIKNESSSPNLFGWINIQTKIFKKPWPRSHDFQWSSYGRDILDVRSRKAIQGNMVAGGVGKIQLVEVLGDLQSLCFSESSESSGWKKMMIDDTLIHFESAQKGSNFTVYSKLKSCQDARVPCKQQRFTHNRPFLHVMFSNSTWFWLPNNGMCTPKKTSILRQVKISQQQTPTWKTLKPSLALYLAGAAGGLKGPGRSKMGFSKSSRTNPFESERQNDEKCR